GHTTQVGWVGGQDGLLVMDRNLDGVINDGRELFGAATVLADGRRAGDGFNALAALDANHDGHITAADGQFNQLKVWVDANHDGKTDAGELKGLAELGIASLNLAHVASDRVDNGNAVGLVSSYTSTDGQQHEMADVWFQRDNGAAAPTAAELLAEAPAEVLPDPAASAPPAAPVAHAAVLPVAHHASHDEDLLRHQPPLL
ncbi:MAG: hypothetical protein HY855_19650, partial [Burkholderiales bacterium]|nr:hypothetical protein [Burkholderiales bacterium]